DVRRVIPVVRRDADRISNRILPLQPERRCGGSAMKRGLTIAGLVAAAALAVWLPGRAGGTAAAQRLRDLSITFVDVEGGAATLIVTPAGESVLIDCGWPGEADRDPKRIRKA